MMYDIWLHTVTLYDRRPWNYTFNSLRKNNIQLRILYPFSLSIKWVQKKDICRHARSQKCIYLYAFSEKIWKILSRKIKKLIKKRAYRGPKKQRISCRRKAKGISIVMVKGIQRMTHMCNTSREYPSRF